MTLSDEQLRALRDEATDPWKAKATLGVFKKSAILALVEEVESYRTALGSSFGVLARKADAGKALYERLQWAVAVLNSDCEWDELGPGDERAWTEMAMADLAAWEALDV